jgi:ribosome biogenesis protein BRX1
MAYKRKASSSAEPPINKRKEALPEESDDELSADEAAAVTTTPLLTEGLPTFDGQYVNKQRCLVFCTRGVTARARHLLEDIRKLLPHHKKDAKLDVKDNLRVVNEISEIKSCNSALFFEARKRQDLYLWASKTPHGPSAKFLVSNVHTMDELRMTGNCMMGSRPLLSFDAVFDSQPHFKLIKAMFIDVFGAPRGHPKSKPFIDRVMSFHHADGKVWVRNYQILDAADGDKRAEAGALREGREPTQLVEIGPRFVLTPIRIFAGSFCGATLYTNPRYQSPNHARAEAKAAAGSKYTNRKVSGAMRKEKEESLVLPVDEMADTFA